MREAADLGEPSHDFSWRNVIARIFSGIVLVPIAVACLWVGSWLFAGLVVLVCWGAAYEWHRLVGRGAAAPILRSSTLFYDGMAVVAVGLAFSGRPLVALLATALGTLALPLWLGLTAAKSAGVGAFDPLVFYRLLGGPDGRPEAAPARRILPWILGGLCYFLVPAALLQWMREDAVHGLTTTLWVLCVIWAYDTGAYSIGTALRGPSFLPSISPNKTWSGILGGTLFAVVMGIGFETVRGGDGQLLLGPLGGLIGLVGQAGDLYESWLKRRFGVKDTGRAIPGHGGIIDRLDSVVTAVVAAAIVVALAGGQEALWISPPN